MSASYQLGFLDGTMLEGSMITLDIQNLTQSDSMSYIGSPNNVYGVTYRGAQYILGFRGKF
jgi:hypothetical protein